jgi:hypothetical protein
VTTQTKTVKFENFPEMIAYEKKVKNITYNDTLPPFEVEKMDYKTKTITLKLNRTHGSWVKWFETETKDF